MGENRKRVAQRENVPVPKGLESAGSAPPGALGAHCRTRLNDLSLDQMGGSAALASKWGHIGGLSSKKRAQLSSLRFIREKGVSR